MKIKTKFILNSLIISNWGRKSRKMNRKWVKFHDEEKYPIERRHTFVLKRFKRLMKILNVDVEVIGYDNLPKAPALITPNHSSSMDPGLILMALENPDPSPDARDGIPVFLSKIEISQDKKAKGYAGILDTFYIDRNNIRKSIEEIDKMSEFAKEQKRYSVIFPEGTRSKDGNIGLFKGGAFKNAKKTYVPIVPITINNAIAITDVNRTERLKVQIVIHKPIKPMSFMASESKAIAENVQKIIQKSWTKPVPKSTNEQNKTLE